MRTPLILLAVALAACQSESSYEPSSVDIAADAAFEVNESGGAVASRAQDQSAPGPASANVPVRTVQDTTARQAPVLIRRASLDLRVDDYDEASAAVPGIVGRFDAYLAGEEESRQPYRVSNTYTIRVAAPAFDSLMAALVGLADEVDGRRVSVDDVTEEFVDTAARLEARRAVEARYVALLGRASSVEEVLQVQRALAEVREEIESAEGRLRWLRDRAAMSTVTLTLYEASPTGLASGPGFFARIGGAVGDGWELLLGLLVGAVTVWPLWLLVGVAAWALRGWRRRRRAVAAP